MAQSAMNSGLESLAAEASRRAESLELQNDVGASTEGNGSKSASQGSGQKGKVRKAYTITKQRERWTDSEHERFLQALKRYGRAWRKIEEHIGTKTAVQIRSHAQKFFSKLQREQSANGGTGDESSKAGISIPPPRPKRKPVHPYPRKTNGDSTTDNGSSQQQQQSFHQTTSTAPSSAPSHMSLPAFPQLDCRGAEASLSQVLEAAAVAAASAWSQVVASAGSKVQQQLQAHVVAQQGLQSLQPLLGMKSGVLYQMAAQQHQQQSQQPVAANLQSSSQHPMGRSPFCQPSSPERTGAAVRNPRQAMAQSHQDSPDGIGNAADQGNDRDSACSKEYKRNSSAPKLEHATSTAREVLQKTWRQQTPGMPLQPEAGFSRGAWQTLMNQVQAANAATSQWSDPLRLATMARHPSRAFSAGATLNDIIGSPPAQPEELAKVLSKGMDSKGTDSKSSKRDQSPSDTSQLARYFQQAAAEQQQAAHDSENIENGSSGEGGGSSGGRDASNGKLNQLRSDKGSNMANSGSDEDANGNISRSDPDANDQNGDAAGNDAKGSDNGSNSPRGSIRNNSPSSIDLSKPSVTRTNSNLAPPVFMTNSSDRDQTKSAATATQQQEQSAFEHSAPVQQPVPSQTASLPQQTLAAIQQRALSAWASNIQQQAAQSNLQMLQGLMKNFNQTSGKDGQSAIPGAMAPSLSLAGELSTGDRKSSGVPSMDTFNANSLRSYSVPLGVANGSVSSQEPGFGAGPEEASGFKPYNKRHGMPITALPPAKRFALGTSDTQTPKPTAQSSNPLPVALLNVPKLAQPPFFFALQSFQYCPQQII